MKPDLCSYTNTGMIQSTVPPQQPYKRGIIFLGLAVLAVKSTKLADLSKFSDSLISFRVNFVNGANRDSKPVETVFLNDKTVFVSESNKVYKHSEPQCGNETRNTRNVTSKVSKSCRCFKNC